MPKFFIERNQIQNNEIEIIGEECNHIVKVLRHDIGDLITLCDGHGMDYLCRIEEMDKKRVVVTVLEKISSKTEPVTKITLFQGLPKSDKMEWIIQKTTELGVDEIYPMNTTRAIVKIKDDKREKDKVQRWQKVALEACKQSNRSRVPTVYSIINFSDALEMKNQFDLMIIPYEKQQEGSLQSLLQSFQGQKIAILIGPEGGFEEEEVQLAVKKGVFPISLGPRILRTETAAIISVGLVMSYKGEME